MFLTDEDTDMLIASFAIVKRLYERLRDLHVVEAKRDISELNEKIQRKYARKDRKDTRYFDVVAENAITLGEKGPGMLTTFERILGRSGVVITEECGRIPRSIRIEHDTPVVISDPVDGSAYLDYAIEKLWNGNDQNTKMGAILDGMKELESEENLRRHACSTSLTFMRDNTIKFAVVLNLFTGDIYIASSDGVFMGNIKNTADIESIATPLEFNDAEGLSVLCYTTKGKYEENRVGTHLRFFPLHANSRAEIGPIGPLRFTNLVRFGDNSKSEIHVVAHNGEKVQEILTNIAVALFSKGRLHAYKLFCDAEYNPHRAGKPMTPVLANSLYSDGLIANTGIKTVFLNNYDYPSEFRDTTAIISSENDAALTMFTGMVNRGYATRIV